MSILSDESRPLLDVGRIGSDPSIGAAAKEQASYRLLAVTWVAFATIIRFASVARLPLANGEAYYATWSRFLDWSYYDHPPLMAWMVRATTMLGASSGGIRLGPVLCAGAFGLLFYRLAERFFGPRAAFFSLILVTAIPVFLISSFVLNPEAPLAPLWVGYLLVLEGMRERDESYRPLLAGLLLGAAFLAKYTAVLLVPTTFIYLAASAPSRRWLRRPSLYAGGAIGGGGVSLVLFCDAHGWPTLQLHFVERGSVGVPVAGENTINHLMEDASTPGTSALQNVARLLVGQFLSYSPLLAPILLVALVRIARNARRDDRDLFLASFSWPALLLLLAAMLRLRDAEQHWTMVAFIPAAIAAGRYADEAWSSTRRVSRLAVSGVALSFFAFALGVVHFHSNAIVALMPARYDARADMANEMTSWEPVRASIGRAVRAAKNGKRDEGDNAPVVLASNHYALCGKLLMEMDDVPNVYCPTSRRSAFDFFERRDPPRDATVVVLTDDIHTELPAGLESRTCALSDEVDVDRAGRQVARYFVHTCRPIVNGASAPRAAQSAPQELEKRASRD
jgi:hypothetical protein